MTWLTQVKEELTAASLKGKCYREALGEGREFELCFEKIEPTRHLPVATIRIDLDRITTDQLVNILRFAYKRFRERYPGASEKEIEELVTSYIRGFIETSIKTNIQLIGWMVH